MGLDAEELGSFSAPFREGMCQVDRLRRLGDRFKDEWQGTVIEGGYNWSGNRRQANPDDQPYETPCTVHALLLIYDKDDEAVVQWADRIAAAVEPLQVHIVRRLPLDLRPDGNGIGREHFGFADGLSQPIPFEEGAVVFGDGSPVPRDPWHGVPLGDVLLGHVDSHHEVPPGPVVRARSEPADPPLPAEGARNGFLNFGLDGTYLVVRELRQNVPAFWHSLDSGTQRIRQRDPATSGHVTADWLAERVVGRNLDGHLLCPSGLLAADKYGQPQNDFGFLDNDPHGHGCPPGSHVRRGNPRDGLAKDKGDAPTLLAAANNHRLLRRGRKFGATIADQRVPDDVDRGLLFICLNTDINRQFEFVQQTWLANPGFQGLTGQQDPLINDRANGSAGYLIPSHDGPARLAPLPSFIRTLGGGYFFMPGKSFLAFLGGL
jgi:deferrochelatase/peroxidase EfeB